MAKTKQQLEQEITKIKEELENAKQQANDNLEYAKQATKDVNAVQSESFSKGHQTKAIVDTVSNALDMLDAVSGLLRKALERDLTKDFSGEAKNQIQDAHSQGGSNK